MSNLAQQSKTRQSLNLCSKGLFCTASTGPCLLANISRLNSGECDDFLKLGECLTLLLELASPVFLSCIKENEFIITDESTVCLHAREVPIFDFGLTQCAW